MAKGIPLAAIRHLLALLLCLGPAGVGAETDGATAVRELLMRHASAPGVLTQVTLPDITLRKLAECPQPHAELAGHSPPRWGSLTVRVRCAGSKRPLFVRAKVSAEGTYWVLARDVDAGTPLDVSLLQQQRGDLTRLPANAVARPGELTDKVAARPLPKGAVLQSHWLKTPALVKRRQTVTLLAVGRGFRITREGQALDEGGRGDRIRVRLDNGEVIRGIVSAPGTVTLAGY